MKPIRKAERLAFNAAIAEILSQFHPDPRGYKPGIVRCMTDLGPLTITPDELEHGDKIPTVFSRFRDTDTDAFKQRRHGLDASMVGKWNIHTYEPDQCIRELKRRLALVNARRLTDAEWQEWKEHDARENAKWAVLREEVTP